MERIKHALTISSGNELAKKKVPISRFVDGIDIKCLPKLEQYAMLEMYSQDSNDYYFEDDFVVGEQAIENEEAEVFTLRQRTIRNRLLEVSEELTNSDISLELKMFRKEMSELCAGDVNKECIKNISSKLSCTNSIDNMKSNLMKLSDSSIEVPCDDTNVTSILYALDSSNDKFHGTGTSAVNYYKNRTPFSISI